MRTIHLILTICCALTGTILSAQNGIVTGTVTDSRTRELLVGVVITSEGRSGALTNDQGVYELALLPGKHTLTFRYVSYNEKSIDIIVEAGVRTELNVQLEPMANDFRIVVISAGKYEQDLGEITVSMEVLKPGLVQDKNMARIDEGLQQAPGVAIVDDEPQIRSGSGYSFGAGSRVQVLVDDMPVLSGDAGKPSWGFLPVENLAQVEIIKGASSVLYGSSALSGVINFRTAYPELEPKTKLILYQGIFSAPESSDAKFWNASGMRSGLNFLHTRKAGPLDVVLSIYMLGDDGHLSPIRNDDGSFEDAYNPFTVDRFAAEKRGRITLGLTMKPERIRGLNYGLNVNYNESESLATLIWENDTTGLYGAYEGSATRTIQQLYTIDPFVSYYTRTGMKHSLRTRWQSLDNNNDNDQGNFSDVYYAEYQYQHHWDSLGIKGLTTTFGLVGILTDARGELFTGGNPDGRNEATNSAVYLQADKKFFGKLNVSAGMRYEQFTLNNEKEGKPVFRSGLNYQVAQATFIRSSFGQGFRFPSVAEKFIITSLGAIRIFANPDLKSESSWNAELGIKQGFKIGDFKGFADVAVFRQEFTNFIEFTFGQWDPNPTFDNQLGLGFKSVNTGKARVDGVDFSIMGEGKIGTVKYTLLAGYMFTQPTSLTPDQVYATATADPDNPFVLDRFREATFTNTSSDPSGNILKYRMQHLIRADIGAAFKQWSLGVSFRSNSHMKNIDAAFGELETQFPGLFNPGINRWRAQNTTGDYVFDLRAAWEISERHKVSLVINNLLNREYAIRPLAIEEPRLTMIQYSLTL